MEVEAEQRAQFRREGGLLEEWIGDISVRRVQDERIEQHGAVRIIESSHELLCKGQSLCLCVEGLQ